jgi:hypothetical protein
LIIFSIHARTSASSGTDGDVIMGGVGADGEVLVGGGADITT